MTYLLFATLTALFAFLWRVRGGFLDEKIKENKIWFDVYFALLSYWFAGLNIFLGFIAAYTSHQLFGWGVYVSSLLDGGPLDPEKHKENPLIDEVLAKCKVTLKGTTYYLYQYPRLYGFVGTSLAGFFVTFLWGLFLNSKLVLFSGLSMGLLFWLGNKLEKVWPLGKSGWNWGEWLFGAFTGAAVVWHFISI